MSGINPPPEKSPKEIWEDMQRETKEKKEKKALEDAALKIKEAAEKEVREKKEKEAAEKKAKEDALQAEEVRKSTEASDVGGSNFKSRVLPPVFDANVPVFKCLRRVYLGEWSYHVGDFIFPDNHPHLKGRNLRLLFEQKYLGYPTQEEFSKLLGNPEACTVSLAKAVETVKLEQEQEQKEKEEIARKAKEEFEKRQKNRVYGGIGQRSVLGAK